MNLGTLGEQDSAPRDQREAADDGRLLARPREVNAEEESSGLEALNLGTERDGLLYVPSGYDSTRPAPFALMLHGATWGAREGLAPFLDLADEVGLILLAPESRSRTWDPVLKGPDLEFVDRALESVFSRYAVNPLKLGVCGFSDGASYALSLGLTNGDLFSHAVAFSPGRVATEDRRGMPDIFVSHGTEDKVLPIDKTSRQIVPWLRQEGYNVRYEEFNGRHKVPPKIAREALSWFLCTEAGRH